MSLSRPTPGGGRSAAGDINGIGRSEGRLDRLCQPSNTCPAGRTGEPAPDELQALTSILALMTASRDTDSQATARDVVTMDKIVALSKRRGFVFPSSEIYGGLGSTYDYGHYGVLLKNNVKAQWWRAMLQERDDVVALDSAIIQHPRTWEASGHLAGFTDPLIDCRTCKLRFRADHLQQSACGRKPSKHPGET